MVIHIQWEGPLTIDEVLRKSDTLVDRGVYQIYGSHPVYGGNTLLYIGRTSGDATTFAARVGQHKWRLDRDLAQNTTSVYLGRLAGSTTPDEATWKAYISNVEALLITAHKPSWNSASILDLGSGREDQIADTHLLNWGVFGLLLPEVSAARWTQRLADVPHYHVFGSKGLST